MALLEMLVELDSVCKKHNIRYCIIAGTLLGAVRHKGFIPWDDDLDVAMTRREYEKFRKACASELAGTNYFFQDNTTDPHYPWGYGRLRRTDSEFVRLGQAHLKMRTGIFLDIFPLDSVPDFPPLRGLFAAYCFLLRKILYSEVGKVSAGGFIYRVLNFIPKEWVFDRLESLHSDKNTKYVRILTFPTPKGQPFGYPRKWYLHLADVEFEGRMFPGIADWDAYLSYKFGDYMTLPLPKQRRWHPCSEFRLPE
jgi:lipopolysaccharide cholinephosphotransferase